MSNKVVIIILLYARIRHVQFKWRSCQREWWRTIDPSTILDKTDMKDGINLPSFMPITNIIKSSTIWVGGWGLTWRMVYIYRHSCKKMRFLWGRVMPMHNVLIDHTPCMNLNGTGWEPTGEKHSKYIEGNEPVRPRKCSISGNTPL